MVLRLIFIFFFICSISYAQNDTVTYCRFYAYNDESVFIKNKENTLDINFYINNPSDDNSSERINFLLSKKKGINKYNVNPVNENEINILLNTSPLFDAHYLRIILERQLNVTNIHLNDQQITWEEFEKKFLNKSN